MLAPGRPANGFEHVVRVEADGPAGGQTAVEGFGDLRRCPDQDVGVPDGRYPEFWVGADFHPHIADMILNWREAGSLGQAEKWPLHRVALVTDGDVREVRSE